MLPVASFLLLLGLASACSPGDIPQVRDEVSRIPKLGIRPVRIAVLVPPTKDPTLAYAYARLETMTNHLLREALGTQVVERGDLTVIHLEQRWQHAEPASEETTARLGRLSGADALVLYRILSPSFRERLFASEESLSPVAIIGKVVRVETGEVVWTHLVSVAMQPMDRWRGTRFDSDPMVRQALDHGVEAMEAALNSAVRCAHVDCVSSEPEWPRHSPFVGNKTPAAFRCEENLEDLFASSRRCGTLHPAPS